ncbi:MAG: 4'-phosphopantetheinyl transferase superfamily protein [Candidatus Dactylopiibacterium sp.]|nr:4'-phosphopantetheinyl transferase superfamily protein [Candidatus Dactylopiibacterium sp.]
MDIELLQCLLLEAFHAGQPVVLLATPGDASLARARQLAQRLSAWLAGLLTPACGGLSRSATPGLAAVAVCREGAVGVDAQARAGVSAQALAGPFAHPDELRALSLAPPADTARLALWARKEAVLKAWGVGLGIAPAEVRAGLRDEAWCGVRHPVLGAAHLCSLAVREPDHSVAVALAGQAASRATPALAIFTAGADGRWRRA